ncbi:MAG: DNA oxidative demethylase AlkB [Chromatiales bacterium]|nr:DNA oxidative demethylase AlkB [Chromatiales bacterium]
MRGQITLLEPVPVELGPGAWHMPGRALAKAGGLLDAIAEVIRDVPLRQMLTPGGRRICAPMTNCGRLGWISDRRGYRYSAEDPLTGRPWPPMPELVAQLARQLAGEAGYAGFEPDACLVNAYRPGMRMGLHQDRDEADMSQPIVSVSLGLPAVFLWGGLRRGDKARRVTLAHGDALVFGGESRMCFHGIAPVARGRHPKTGELRYNLTLRRAAA